MSENFRARLERAFEMLKKLDITPILSLTGSSGVRDWNADLYRSLAKAAGTAGSWVGAHVGLEEHDGGYWGSDGILRLRYDASRLKVLWFHFSTGDAADALVTALRANGIDCTWTGADFDAVRVHLDEEN